jgi:hypothetical protein
MKGRWIAMGAVIGLGVALTLGFAFGHGSRALGSDATDATSWGDASDWWTAMDAMHDSPWMEQIREQMGPGFAAQCDQLHEQVRDRVRAHMSDEMREHMAPVGGFGPIGMMGGRGTGPAGYGPGAMMGT